MVLVLVTSAPASLSAPAVMVSGMIMDLYPVIASAAAVENLWPTMVSMQLAMSLAGLSVHCPEMVLWYYRQHYGVFSFSGVRCECMCVCEETNDAASWTVMAKLRVDGP